MLTAARRLLPALLSVMSCVAMLPVFAAPAAAAEACPNAASRQGPSVELPDCRAYEQVTPVNKGDAEDIFPNELPGEERHSAGLGYASEDGNRFLLDTSAIFSNGGQAYDSIYVFSRGAAGWGMTPIAPGIGTNLLEAAVFNPELTEIGIKDRQIEHVPGQPEEQVLASVLGPPGGPYTVIGSTPFSAQGETTISGASTDLSHVILEGNDHHLVSAAEALDERSSAVYEASGGQFHLVNVNSGGSLVSQCGAVLGQGSSINEEAVPGGSHNAVSPGGATIVFTAPDPKAQGAGCWNRFTTPQENPPQVYVRLNGTTTIDISKPEPGVNDPTLYPAVYVGASKDGTKIFFMTETEVTKDDRGHAVELYEYDLEAPEGERLTRVSSGEAGDAEGIVDFVPAISADGSTVYFTAYNQLVADLPTLEPEEVYLYRYNTLTGKTTYVTRIESYGYPQVKGEQANNWVRQAFASRPNRPGIARVGAAAEAEWYTTANGAYLVFASVKGLTGYDSEAPAGDARCVYFNNEYHATTYNHCLELFRYSASSNSIVCVSCGAPGTQPVESALFARSWFPGPASQPPTPISEDGSEVFFDTSNALVPNTGDEKIHVYEWHEGTISLLSSPDDPGNAYFLGATADGTNVYLGTHAQLAPQDTDFLGDVYDARVDGGFVPVTAPQCTGTGCQGVAAAPPVFATPASVTFEGVGNFAPVPTPAEHAPRAKPHAGAQAKALKACRRFRNRRKRKTCEARVKRGRSAARRSVNSTGGVL